MASRNAAFSLLRRMALQDFVAVSAPMRSRSMAFPILRPLLRPRHYHATTPLRRVPGPKVAIPAPETSPLPFKTREPHSSVQPTVATQPSYEMTFTCKPCGVRSTHLVSKQGYHKGSVLITCPDCHNRHIISDHLKIFGDDHVTIEDLMRDRGQLVKKGTLSEDGALEFWEDGTQTERKL